ncbi:MAG: endonuclease/exonuclease/phosphatase family protein [Myxococcales bacterium]|nr:endonuclease/exonuclease/phosphatase family protein [Myxococcales bacterium]
MGPLFLTAVLLAAPGTSAAPPAPARPVVLRVITFNVWGLRLITPDRRPRIEAIADYVARAAPDMVSFQEVWVDSDAHLLRDRRSQAGLHYSSRFEGAGSDSGLLLVSRYPILETHFTVFADGHTPHTPWHLDWAVDKGVGVARVEAPFGPLEVAVTHMQSGYGSDEYRFVQLGQVLQAVDSVAPSTEGHPPLVFAGDLNAGAGTLPFEALTAIAGLTPSVSNSGIDAVLTRSGDGVCLAPLATHMLFTAPVALSNGHERPLSDHPAVVAEIAATPCDSARRWTALQPPITAALLPAIERECDTRRWTWARDGIVAISLILLVWAGRGRRRTRRGAALRVVSWAALLWMLYRAAWFGPDTVRALSDLGERARVHVANTALSPSSAESVKLAHGYEGALPKTDVEP